jgi:hypothetical protein
MSFKEIATAKRLAEHRKLNQPTGAALLLHGQCRHHLHRGEYTKRRLQTLPATASCTHTRGTRTRAATHSGQCRYSSQICAWCPGSPTPRRATGGGQGRYTRGRQTAAAATERARRLSCRAWICPHGNDVALGSLTSDGAREMGALRSRPPWLEASLHSNSSWLTVGGGCEGRAASGSSMCRGSMRSPTKTVLLIYVGNHIDLLLLRLLPY